MDNRMPWIPHRVAVATAGGTAVTAVTNPALRLPDNMRDAAGALILPFSLRTHTEISYVEIGASFGGVQAGQESAYLAETALFVRRMGSGWVRLAGLLTFTAGTQPDGAGRLLASAATVNTSYWHPGRISATEITGTGPAAGVQTVWMDMLGYTDLWVVIRTLASAAGHPGNVSIFVGGVADG